MTQQIVCDDCGEPIIQTHPYYEIGGVLLKMTGDPPVLTTVEPAKQMHYHQEHLPASVLEPAPGPPVEPEPEPEPVEPAPPIDPDAHPDHELPVPEEPVDPDYGIPEDGEPVEEPDDDPYPGVDIGSMTIQQALAWADDDSDKIQWALEQEQAGQNRASLVNQLQNKLKRL